MKLSGKFFKRSTTQVNVRVSTANIGLVWIDRDKTQDIDWSTAPQGSHVMFEVSDALYRELLGNEPEQLELFDAENEL